MRSPDPFSENAASKLVPLEKPKAEFTIITSPSLITLFSLNIPEESVEKKGIIGSGAEATVYRVQITYKDQVFEGVMKPVSEREFENLQRLDNIRSSADSGVMRCLGTLPRLAQDKKIRAIFSSCDLTLLDILPRIIAQRDRNPLLFLKLFLLLVNSNCDTLTTFKNTQTMANGIVSTGTIHNDVKPANMGLYQMKVTVFDFGCAQAPGEHEEYLGGTVKYTAPERTVQGLGSILIYSDLWSFGQIAREILDMPLMFEPFDDDETEYDNYHKRAQCFNEAREKYARISSSNNFFKAILPRLPYRYIDDFDSTVTPERMVSRLIDKCKALATGMTEVLPELRPTLEAVRHFVNSCVKKLNFNLAYDAEVSNFFQECIVEIKAEKAAAEKAAAAESEFTIEKSEAYEAEESETQVVEAEEFDFGNTPCASPKASG